MLTLEQVEALRRPFAPEAHEWRSGFCYITEHAIVERLNEVDPNWQFVIISIARVDGAAVCHGRLIVSDVTRDGVGMDKANSANEPEKSAATDALKRAARLFGIGQYLLVKPSWVTDNAGIARWLAGESPARQPSQTQPARLAPLPAPAPDGELYVDARELTAKRAQNGNLFYVVGGVSIFRKAFDQLQAALGAPLPQDEGTFTMPAPLRVYYVQGEKYKELVRLTRLEDLAFATHDNHQPSGPQPSAYLSMPASILRTADTIDSVNARKALVDVLSAAGLNARAEQDVMLKSLGIAQWSDYTGTVGQLLAIINPSELDMPI